MAMDTQTANRLLQPTRSRIGKLQALIPDAERALAEAKKQGSPDKVRREAIRSQGFKDELVTETARLKEIHRVLQEAKRLRGARAAVAARKG